MWSRCWGEFAALLGVQVAAVRDLGGGGPPPPPIGPLEGDGLASLDDSGVLAVEKAIAPVADKVAWPRVLREQRPLAGGGRWGRRARRRRQRWGQAGRLGWEAGRPMHAKDAITLKELVAVALEGALGIDALRTPLIAVVEALGALVDVLAVEATVAELAVVGDWPVADLASALIRELLVGAARVVIALVRAERALIFIAAHKAVAREPRRGARAVKAAKSVGAGGMRVAGALTAAARYDEALVDIIAGLAVAHEASRAFTQVRACRVDAAL